MAFKYFIKSIFVFFKFLFFNAKQNLFGVFFFSYFKKK